MFGAAGDRGGATAGSVDLAGSDLMLLDERGAGSPFTPPSRSNSFLKPAS